MHALSADDFWKQYGPPYTSNGLDIVHIYIFVNLFLKPATFTIHAFLLCYTKISYNW